MYVLEALFSAYTRRIKTLTPHLAERYANEFLLRHWVLGNPYRDHIEKNFEDKIFFFEPINKFFDLLWVKRLAFFECFKLSVPLSLPPGPSLEEIQAPTDVLKQTSIEYETFV